MVLDFLSCWSTGGGRGSRSGGQDKRGSSGRVATTVTSGGSSGLRSAATCSHFLSVRLVLAVVSLLISVLLSSISLLGGGFTFLLDLLLGSLSLVLDSLDLGGGGVGFGSIVLLVVHKSLD